MLVLIPAMFSSLVVCFLLTPFFRDFFGVLGLVDKPDSSRKTHSRPIPRVGGVALIVAYFVAFVTLAFGWWRGLLNPQDPAIIIIGKLSPAIILIFAVGLYDDLCGLTPLQKLAGQLTAAMYACAAGVRLAVPAGYAGPTILIYVGGILWLVLCTNAFNLIDGLDGLATGVALIASASLLLVALMHHNPGLALVIAPLIGALIGFLYYNFNPASIFLGDCGSLLIGFLLGCYGLMWHSDANSPLSVFAPFIALALPVFEVALSVCRRFVRSRPIFSSDRDHIHHKILSLGISHRHAALILYGVAGLIAGVAVLQTIIRPQFATILLVLFFAVAYVGLRSLHYPEFKILRQFIFAGGFRRTLKTNVYLHEYQELLDEAKTVDDCWRILRNTCKEVNICHVSLRVNGRVFREELYPSSRFESRLRVNFSETDEAIFGHDARSAVSSMLIAPLAERLQEKLSSLAAIKRPHDSDPPHHRALSAKRAVAGIG